MISRHDSQRRVGFVQVGKNFVASIWFFPSILLLPLIVFTVLQISGSSVSSFHEILYGEGKDQNLILNEPRAIRSDEWLVNTQQTIAQAESNFSRTNPYIGIGQDMSTVDVPYKDWSIIFRPHNMVFFVLPFENAFAFKWWIMGYLLIVSCYFFVLTILPKKRLLASLLSLALFFSAFVQWWYLYGTLGSIYYSFFIILIVMALCRQRELWKKLLLALLLAYVATCFALVLYPPFQIACGLVVVFFLLGYAIQHYPIWGKRLFAQNLLVVLGSGLISAALVGAFIFTRLDVVNAINNTVYPGTRSLESGKFFPEHFFSSHLGYQFTSDERTGHYLINKKDPGTNPSEASNFLLVIPFLFLPSLLLLYYERRYKLPFNWPLLLLNVLFAIFLCQLFLSAFTPLSKLLLLNKVGDARLLIGVGLLNIIAIALTMRSLSKKKVVLPVVGIAVYCLVVLVVELLLSFDAQRDFGSFISAKRALLFSLPLPIIIYLVLTKRYAMAALGYLAFSVLISFRINPLYKGLDTLTSNPLSIAISHIGSTSDKRWVTDGGYLENIASINGERSLSGVYNYPQHGLWKSLPDGQNKVYNRYAHVGVQLTDNPRSPTTLSLLDSDSFVVKTYSCDPYLRSLEVGYILSANILKSPCTKVIKTLPFPNATLYIYKLQSGQ